MSRATSDNSRPPRPTAPHLQVYKLTWTMAMSIAHRISGAGLYAASLFFAWWLLALSSGPDAYYAVQDFFALPIGRIILFFCTWALMHHMLGGLRHFFWDFGYGFEERERFFLAKATLFGGVAATVLVWAIGYALR